MLDILFFGLEPTGRIGTSIEYFILRITNGQVTRFWVSDHTMNLTMYLTRERGMHYLQNFVPEAVIRGLEADKFFAKTSISFDSFRSVSSAFESATTWSIGSFSLQRYGLYI